MESKANRETQQGSYRARDGSTETNLRLIADVSGLTPHRGCRAQERHEDDGAGPKPLPAEHQPVTDLVDEQQRDDANGYWIAERESVDAETQHHGTGQQKEFAEFQ